MKSFILVVIFIAYSVSANTDTQSVKVSKQIQCYLRKLKASIPADAIPQDEALIRDARAVQNNINAFNTEGVICYLKDASAQLATVLPKLTDPKLRKIAIQIMPKIKAVQAKFESGNGGFYDIFNLNTSIEKSLRKCFDCGCPESTLPEGVTTSDVVTSKIKHYLNKLKASASSNAKPIYDELIKNVDDVLKQSIGLNQSGVIDVLKKDANDVRNLIATMCCDNQGRRHQQNILEKLNTLIKKFECGNGTYQDVYEFLQFVEKTLARDV